MSLSGWTLEKMLLDPAGALAALEDYERRRMTSTGRVRDLLEANNRYLNDARCARDELKALRERILGYRD